MTLNLRVGDWVEVLSEAEILATLDERGELDNLPFMPEMVKYCGQRLTVHKVAHKLCDTVSGKGGLRRMTNAVHLTGARCDGSAHGGCQTACSMYWKESWLRKVDGPAPARSDDLADGRPLLKLVELNARKAPGEDGEERFSCQATELLRAAPTCLPFKDFGQYVQDVRTGNAGVLATLRAIWAGLFNHFQYLSRKVLPRKLWIKDGLSWGFVRGRVTGRTPTGALNLQPGELVRIKPKAEIEATLDENRLNRGMGFEEEMARYCGTTARVLNRVDRCIDEKTGRMLTMKSPCIVLEGVVCAGAYKGNCPREFVPFWREIWLERV
ncbi:MAG TPA: hypothetical protein VGX25_10780 [Actinophytocola sp.]|uniref:hypothetical protein n=1 Tax=Actinophytocola sp. TaxID=1872138 RepID=UPI002DDD5927|nr:hypothetical protein [Actinophytocola sp.]HEV2779871.1 hypothetical protein [Actinophytocola sp.]